MKYRNAILTTLIVIGFSLMFSETSFAADATSCKNDSANKNITAIINACNACFDPNESNGERGAIWINNSNNASDYGIYINSLVDKVNVNLYGSYYSCSGKDSHSGNANMNAHRVAFYWDDDDAVPRTPFNYFQSFTNPSKLPGIANEWGASVSGVQVDRVGNTPWGGKNEWSGPGEPTKGEFLVKNFIKDSRVTKTTGADGSVTYKANIFIYRCPWIASSGSKCYSDPFPISVTISNPPQETSSLYTSSQVSNRSTINASEGGSGDYVSTGVLGPSSINQVARTADNNIDAGETVQITFSHDVFSDTPTTIERWAINRTINGVSSGFYSNDEYTVGIIAPSPTGGPSGLRFSANSTNNPVSGNTAVYTGTKAGAYYTSYNYTDGGKDHFYRNYYEIKFHKEGTYEFCETISLNNTPYTKACTTVIVGPKQEITNQCGVDYTTVDIKQRRENGSAYRSWTDGLIYAKPTDKLGYTFYYCAGVQVHADDYITTEHGEHDVDYDTDNTNVLYRNGVAWDNRYFSYDPGGGFNHGYRLGEIVKKPFYNSAEQTYIVDSDDVGNVLEGYIESSAPSAVETNDEGTHPWVYDYTYSCPGEPDSEGNPTTTTCHEDHPHEHTSNYIWHDEEGPVSKEVYVRIPYNYVIKDGDQDSEVYVDNDTVYAGETITVSYANVGINPLYSNTLSETYATRTQSATVTLYSFWFNEGSTIKNGDVQTSSLCSYYGGKGCTSLVTEGPRVLNSDSNLNGKTEIFFNNKQLNVHDAPAGSEFCVAYEVSLAQSSSDPDSDSSNGYRYVSKPSCRTIVKKPIFQVWGGGIYSDGGLNARIQQKNNVNGYTNYTATGNNNIIFSPWVEDIIVAGGNVMGVASGNAAGYTTNNNGTLVFNPGGSNEGGSVSDCKRSPLTISNSTCETGIGNSGITVDNSVAESIRSDFVDEAKRSGVESPDISIISNTGGTNSASRKYFYFRNNATLSPTATLTANNTNIVYAEGNVYIENNLTYSDGPYTSLAQIPQYIIITDGDIYIDCSVTRVDAQLIADQGIIKTCANESGTEPDADARERSHQLVINGSIITKQLILGRTYGAGTGNSSGIPAEIINLTPTTRLWAGSSASETPTLHTVFTKELAPRY